MPQNSLKWNVPEYPEYTRGLRWYITAATLGLALLLYCVYSGNFLFALIIIMGVIISVLSSYKKPADIEFAMTEEGVILGDAFHPWKKFQSYWIVEEDGEMNLGLDLKNWLLTDLYIPMKDAPKDDVERFVSQRLPKNPERKNEPISYLIGRKLKI